MDNIMIKILEVVVMVIAALISRYAIPTFKTIMTEDKFNLIVKWAKVFVAAAENIYNEQGQGEEKRAAVMKLITDKASEVGIKITEDQIRAILESALSELRSDGIINDR